jgi:hypothetical protein
MFPVFTSSSARHRVFGPRESTRKGAGAGGAPWGPRDAEPVISPVSCRSPVCRFFFSDDWLRHARFGDPSASLIFSNEAKRWLSASQVLDTICRIGQTQKTPRSPAPPGGFGDGQNLLISLRSWRQLRNRGPGTRALSLGGKAIPLLAASGFVRDDHLDQACREGGIQVMDTEVLTVRQPEPLLEFVSSHLPGKSSEQAFNLGG